MRRLALSLLPLLILAAGCGSKEPSDGEPNTPTAESAQSFGGDLNKFVVGAWCAVEDGSTNLHKKWLFKSDGTFVFHTEDPWRAAGKWTVTDKVVMLEYLTMDGVPWNDARAKIQQAAEGGGQGAVAESLGMEWYFDKMPNAWDAMVVDEDKKHMKFGRTPVEDKPADPPATGDPNNPAPDMQNMPDLSSIASMGSSVQLERLK